MLTKNVMTIACNMDFGSFPFDIQKCPVKLSSDIPRDEVEFVSEVHLDGYEHIISEFEFDATSLHENVSYIHFGTNMTYNMVGYELILTRKSISYLYTYYFPVTGMVMLASISFMIPPETVPGRIALLVTLLLTMISLFGNIQVQQYA